MLNYQVINKPTAAIQELLKNKMNSKNREKLGDASYGAIAIFQTTVPSMYMYADIGQKAGNVITVEILGNCPQSLGSIAFWGEVSSVDSAIKAVIEVEAREKKK